MERRNFFRAGIGRVVDVGSSAAEAAANKRARRWVRPPFALSELEFLLACTRCDKCVEACPHDVVFALAVDTGIDVAGTPALDVMNKGCQLCSDWPCISACEDAALILPEVEPAEIPPRPKLARVSIDTDTCLPYQGPECGACASACPVPNAMIWRDAKPQIVDEICTGCGLCREACIVEPKAVTIRSIHAPD